MWMPCTAFSACGKEGWRFNMKLRLIQMMFLACLCSFAQAGELSVSLDPPITPFHRPSELHIRYVGDAGAYLDVKVLEKALKEMEQVEVKREDVPSESLEDGQLQQEIIFSLDPIMPGIHILPSILITAGEDALKLPLLLWQVRELNQAELDAVGTFEEIVMPPERPLAEDERVWWLLAIVVALVAAGLGWWWLRNVRPEEKLPPPPAWDVAYRRLKELQSRKMPEQGKFERYYVDLSSILRYYIEDRYGVHAPEQTTQEFLEAATGKLEEQHQAVLAEFLRHCDRVKFARYQPSMNEMKDSYEIVKNFVDQTVPRVTVNRDENTDAEVAA